MALAACATLTVQQQAAATKVQVMSAEPAQNCQNLGLVTGSRDGEGAASLRGKAAVLGANTVRVDPQGTAMAFYCPDPPEPAPDTEPVP